MLSNTNKAEACVKAKEATVTMRYSGVATTYNTQHDGTFPVSYRRREGNWILNRN